MTFKALFKPKWQHKDWKVRRAAVKKLKDPELLANIAKSDDSEYVRKAAMEKSDDQALIADIARNDQDCSVRIAAVERLDPSEWTDLLTDIAKNDEFELVREAAEDKRDPIFGKIRKLVVSGSPSAARQSGEAWPLIRFLYDKLEEGGADERKKAAHYLCYLPSVGHSDSIDRLMLALRKEDSLEVVKSIVWALRGLEAKTAIPELQAMVNDKRYSAIREGIKDGIDYLSGQ